MIEKTLILIKPDGVKRALTGEIISRFEKVGLKIIAMKMIHVDKEFAKKHYPVTEKWYNKVGNNTLSDSEKYGISAKEKFGTNNPIEIGKKVHEWNIEFLSSSPVIAMVLEGAHAIETARKLAGTTIPNLAFPGTIRGDFTSHSALSSNIQNRAIYNLVHTSDNIEEAEREINMWFNKKELYNYKTVHEH